MSLASRLQVAEIIPDVWHDLPGDIRQLTVVYGSAVTLRPGDVLNPAQTKNAPTQLVWESEPAALYTVVMVDPDAPSRRRPRFRNMLHYLSVNITGSDTSSGHTALPYKGPGPPFASGKHRYVQLVLQQTARISPAQLPKFTSWSAGKYTGPRLASTLQKAGSGPVKLVACNWFEAEWDASVEFKQNETFGWMAGPMRLLLWLLR
ncbi:MAG: isoform b [Trebouxia sp. A1-2]|nr:MAG: isoform b [Trebouxia sp. A1-2]